MFRECAIAPFSPPIPFRPQGGDMAHLEKQ